MPTAMEIASTLIGKGEIPDRVSIQKYLKTGGANLDPATTAWCAAFVNSSLAQAGLKGTGSNMARSFLNYGQPTQQPTQGDIAVFQRGGANSPYGHVGFFQGYGPDGKIQVLGGNQGNGVNVTGFDPKQLLGFRHPGDPAPAPETAMAAAAPTQPGQPTQPMSLAQNFAPAGDPTLMQPTLGDAIGTGLASFGQFGQRKKTDADAERQRKEALFGDSGIASMFV